MFLINKPRNPAVLAVRLQILILIFLTPSFPFAIKEIIIKIQCGQAMGMRAVQNTNHFMSSTRGSKERKLVQH